MISIKGKPEVNPQIREYFRKLGERTTSKAGKIGGRSRSAAKMRAARENIKRAQMKRWPHKSKYGSLIEMKQPSRGGDRKTDFVSGSPRHRKRPNKILAQLLGPDYKPNPRHIRNLQFVSTFEKYRYTKPHVKGVLFSTLSEAGRQWALSRLPGCLDKWEIKIGKRPERGSLLFAMICRGLVTAWRCGIRSPEEGRALRKRLMGMLAIKTRILRGGTLIPKGFKARKPKSSFSKGSRKSMTW